jgi:hypothetical protein
MHSSSAELKFEDDNNSRINLSSVEFPIIEDPKPIATHEQDVIEEINDELEEEKNSNSGEDQVIFIIQENAHNSFKGRTQRIGAVSNHLGRRDFNIKKILRSNNKALKLYIQRLVTKYRANTGKNLNRAEYRVFLFEFIRDHFRSEYGVKKRDIYNFLAVCFHFYLGEKKSLAFFKYYSILTI